MKNYQSLNFNKDIESLRGLAIFFVMIYHFYPNTLPLGYLGVDLFFVISGFLITSIFFKQKKFSFLIFIKKRALRLIPSILAIILISIVLSSILFIKNDLENFWKSVFSIILLIPNFYFLLTTGYFGNINELKPLLHIWSLGVEIQFYILFPIILIFLKHYFNKFFFVSIFFIFIISLSINYLFIYLSLDKVNFFMLPSRIWEFSIGSLMYFVPKKKISLLFNNLLFIISILLIFSAITDFFAIHKLLRQFLLCISITLIIYTHYETNLKKIILNNFVFSYLGKISYSLYLIHWPILAFTRYYLIREISFLETSILFFFTIILARYFYFYIENKFQYKNIKKKQNIKVSKLGLVSLFSILFVFLISSSNNFFSQRFSKEVNQISKSINSNYKCNIGNIFYSKSIRICTLLHGNKNLEPEIILLGNSHAQMYGYVFEDLLKIKKINGYIFAQNACLPTTNYNISLECLKNSKEALNKILKLKQIKHVIIGLDWDQKSLIDSNGNKISTDTNNYLIKDLFNLIDILQKNEINTFVLGPISTPKIEFASIASRSMYFKNLQSQLVYRETSFDFENRYKNIFNYVDQKKYKNFIKPHLKQCADGKCKFIKNGNSLFSDSNHLSEYGSFFLGKQIIKLLD